MLLRCPGLTKGAQFRAESNTEHSFLCVQAFRLLKAGLIVLARTVEHVRQASPSFLYIWQWDAVLHDVQAKLLSVA